MPPQMVAVLVQQIIIALVVSHLATALGVTNVAGALMFAVLLWFEFIATVLLNTPSVPLLIFTIIDVCIIFSIWNEYRYQSGKGGLIK